MAFASRNDKTVSNHRLLEDKMKDVPRVITPIGYVCSSYKNTNDIPIKRGKSQIKIVDEYTAGLDGLATSSHVIVLGYLHLADQAALKATSRLKKKGYGKRGIFSVRSPARPNPIAYTVVKLLDVSDGDVTVEGLDFIDGTPILDIKPYSPGWDSIHCATRERRVPLHKMDPRKTLDLLIRDAKNFSGGLDKEGLIAVTMMFILVTKYRIDPRDAKLMIEINRCGTALDALIGMCGATFGSGRIAIDIQPEEPLRCRFYRKKLTLIMKAAEKEKIPEELAPEGIEKLVSVSGLSED